MATRSPLGAVQASPKYKQQDYSQLRAFAQKKREDGETMLKKLAEVKASSKMQQQASRLNKHKFVWLSEAQRLHAQSNALDKDVQNIVHSMALSSADAAARRNADPDPEQIDEAAIWQDILRLEGQYRQARLAEGSGLKSDVGDVNMLAYLHRTKQQNIQKPHVLNKAEKVRTKHEVLRNQLADEEAKLVAELKVLVPRLYNDDGGHHVPPPPVHPPAEDFDAYFRELEFSDEIPFVDPNFHAQLVQQLIELDARFESELQTLCESTEKHGGVADRNGGWPAADHFHVEKVLKEYATQKQHRDLAIDRLQLELPHRSKKAIQDHVEWTAMFVSYENKRKALIQRWTLHRREFILSAKDMLLEAADVELSRLEKEVQLLDEGEARSRKLAALAMLRTDRLRYCYRQQAGERKDFELQLEQEIQREESKKREGITKKHFVQRYQEHLNVQKQREQETQARLEEQERLAQLDLLEQAKERVGFRVEQEVAKKELRRLRQEQDAQLERQRQERLQKLIDSVKIDAPSDPSRVYKPTEASTVAEFKRPAVVGFNALHGYQDHHIVEDKRFRIQQALQRIGLADTDYGRYVLSQVQGPKPQRPEMRSTFSFAQAQL